MKACVFLGPTLPSSLVPVAIDIYGPATLGSIYKAAEAGYARIGLVDGLFGNVPSVWHKEILFALSRGVQVYGAASMGALRAAELYQFGMVGVGRVYWMYRLGILVDDDEVAVIHGPAGSGSGALSEAMVNIRVTLHRMRKAGVISKQSEMTISAHLKNCYFAERSLRELGEIATKVTDQSDSKRQVEAHYFDVKADDAAQLCERLLRDPPPAASERIWTFPSTLFWATQFEQMLADIPDLEPLRRDRLVSGDRA
jgi:hypothetical protein